MELTDTTAVREERYPSFLGATIGAFTTAQVIADGMAKDASLARVIDVLQRPSVEVVGCVGEADGKKIGFGGLFPQAIFADLRTYAPKESELKMSMRVTETNRRNDKTEVSATAESAFAAGGLGWGVGGRFESTVSHSSEQSRETSFESVVDSKMSMEQSAPPLGVQMITSAMGRITEATVLIQEAKAKAALAEEAPNNELPEAPEPTTEAEPESGGEPTAEPTEESGAEA